MTEHTATTTEIELEQELIDVMLCCDDSDARAFDIADVRSFDDAGVMTYNRGLVVRLDDGSEFQITIVRSN